MVVLPWLVRSPDKNCIENRWVILSSAAYADGRQFHIVDGMKEVILYEWEKLIYKVCKI